MKRFLILVPMLLCVLAAVANITHTYNFAPVVVKTTPENSIVELPGSQLYGKPGEPALPWVGTKLLLPIGTEATGITLKKHNPYTIMLEKPIAPVQPQYPLSWEQLMPLAEPDASIYGTDAFFPEVAHNGVNTQFLAGHPINFTAICPVEYNPVTGELICYQSITIEVSSEFSTKAQAATTLLKQDAYISNYLKRAADNDIAIPRYETRTDGYEYIIIHDADKYDQWLPFMQLYAGKGYNMLMKPVQEIVSQFTGVDTQEKIRNYIISMYQTNSLRHVLLAGDTDVIPHRGLYVNFSQGGQMDADIPADMYYSCLDGTWNDDGDAYWGEIYEADLAPELSIGRFCYNSDAEIAIFYNKVMKYLDEPVVSEVKSALFVGEWLWDGPTWGGDYMDEMIGGTSMHGYTTVGVPTNWNITTLYDRTYGYQEAWGPTQICPLLSQGANFVNHLGHSNTTYAMRLSNNQVSATSITNNGTNHNFSIYFTQGCYAGAFDNRTTTPGQYTSDCITEKFTSIATSAVSMISHSRYGWGMQNSTNGASQYFHRQYVDAIFGEDIFELGWALADSKIDNIPFISNSPVMYWVTYETNLIGDPALMVWTDYPQEIIAELPAYWTVGVNSYQIQTNAPQASLRIKSAGEIVYEGVADASGLIYISMLQSFAPGDYDLYITAPNFFSYHTVFTVQASEMPYVVATEVQYLDADNLFHTGEIVNLTVTLENVGMYDQVNPGMVTLSSNSPNIQVLNSSYGFDPIASNGSLVISDFFRIRIQGNYTDHAVAVLTFTTQFDGYTATSSSILILNAPQLSIAGYQFNSPTNVILPGDNLSLNLLLQNTGSGNAFSPLLILFSDSPYVTLSDFEVLLSPIGPDSFANYDEVFSMQISPDAELNTSISIGYLLNAENGNTLEGTFQLYLGTQNYNFEPDMMGWTSSAPMNGFINQWHRSSARNFTPQGSYSMKFGGQGTNNYSNSAYGVLESPEIALGLNSVLRFHHWMDAENHSTPTYAWDGGLVQMSVNNGPWTQITPIGGYPHRIYNNPASPFPANTNVYSGSFDWTEASFNLADYSGMAKFRFIFGSDGYVTGEGWYLDDIWVESEFVENDESVLLVQQVKLFENYPNPFNPSTTISFSLPFADKVSLDIFNLKGQKITTLYSGDLPPGTHSLVWNGRDQNQSAVASGVYLYRLQTGNRVETRKMMLMK